MQEAQVSGENRPLDYELLAPGARSVLARCGTRFLQGLSTSTRHFIIVRPVMLPGLQPVESKHQRVMLPG